MIQGGGFTRAHRPVLIVNPRSGAGGERHSDLIVECRSKGIEPVMVEEGHDIAVLADAVVSQGADVIGMAGGDGSQAAVARVAAEHDVPFVCVPAGTRNHFALDIGVDRNDPVGALEAFFRGSERRIDLARVNGHVFVNNASMGLYGEIVRTPDYRDAKFRTVIERLPELIGPTAEPFDLRFSDPSGSSYVGAQILLVSNNRYKIDPLGASGTRGALNEGTLGVVAGRVAPLLQGWKEWTTPAFRVDSGSRIDLGLDGEAVALDPPLLFESLPRALRIRVPARRRPPLARLEGA